MTKLDRIMSTVLFCCFNKQRSSVYQQKKTNLKKKKIIFNVLVNYVADLIIKKPYTYTSKKRVKNRYFVFSLTIEKGP